jgi:glycosyltransferase involved in cell wall biosynthesis
VSGGVERPIWSIVHVVRSDAFAGVERYVCSVANELAARGHSVSVIGGDPRRMRAELDGGVGNASARSIGGTWFRLVAHDPVRLVHAHMTAAEIAAVFSRMRHRSPIVATRHFPGARGRGPLGRIARTFVERALAAQIAISQFVADGIREPTTVIPNGVPSQPQAELTEPRVLMIQRLEEEKAADVGLRAWAAGGLGERGWRLTIAGSGRLESELRRLTGELGISRSVEFIGRVTKTDSLFASTSIVLAPAPAEPFGLAVVEAMAHGIPVVAAAGGAHLETVRSDGCLFTPGDFHTASAALTRLATDARERRELGVALRERQQALFSLDRHVDALEQLYASVLEMAGAR